MLLAELEYVRPATVDEGIRLLSERDNARALAGGQTLLNVLKTRAASVDLLVDLAGLEELRAISLTADGMLRLGAMVTYEELMGSSEVDVARPILAEVAAQIADVQVRNRGTIGGNVCTSDPTNHFLPLLCALGASFTVAGRQGGRTVAVEDFFHGVYVTAVGQGELLTEVAVPTRQPRQGDGFASVTIGKDGTCVVNAAATVRLDGPIDSARIAIGCVSAVPERASGMEDALRGAEPTEAAIRRAASGLGAKLDPPSDVHATAEYRRHLAEVLAVRAVMQAVERASF